MTQIDPSERAALDADDECYTPLYGAAIEWSNAREATKTAYQFFQNEATRTVARLMLDALIAIEDQKWAAVISATPALAVPPDPATDDADVERLIDEFGKAKNLAYFYALEAMIDQAHSLSLGFDVNLKHDGTIKYWNDQATAARQRILALHRQATHAGLRELRGRVLAMASAADDDESKYDQGAIDMAMRTVDEIDALLKDATYDQPK